MTFRLRGPRVSAVLMTAVLISGCGLFETRDPVVSSGDDSLWQVPVTPDIIVTNLEVALETSNFTDYARALTEDFVFRADAADIAQLEIDRPGEMVFEGWDRDVEAATAATIVDAADEIDVEFVLTDDILVPAGRLVKYDYTLERVVGTAVLVNSGEAWFQVRNEAGEWYIFDWEDIASSSENDSWGLLKGLSRI
ncbi:MAG: hypothetical protein HKN12_09605 [Gemmatimonadetes bacterium]|nr:hypothetical protein [Gemmatimonadota bacterium]